MQILLVLPNRKYMMLWMNTIWEIKKRASKNGMTDLALVNLQIYLGLMVDLSDRYHVVSNRESGFGRYDVMLKPIDKTEDVIIIEFKMHKSKRVTDMEATVQATLEQIREKSYDWELIAEGYIPEQIRHYGFAFRGKEVLIG